MALGLAATAACATAPRALPGGVGPAASPRPSPPGLPGDVAFVNVAVVPMDRERVLRGQTVLVRQGRIAAIGPVGRVRLPAATLRIEARGKYLIPGLADCHAHLSMGSVNDILPDRPRFRHPYDTVAAKHKLFLYLANGVTTLRNVDYLGSRYKGMLDNKALLQLRSEAASGELSSPRIYTSGAWVPDVGTIPMTPESLSAALIAGTWRPDVQTIKPESVAAALAAYQAAGFDFVKVHDESPEVLDSLIAAARRLKLRVVGHLSLEQALAAGAGTSIEHHLFYSDLDRDRPADSSDTATGRWRSELAARAAAMQRAGIWSCPTIRATGYVESYAPVKALRDAGVGLLLGTDLPMPSPRPDKFDPEAVPGDAELLRLGDPGVIHEELVHFVRAGLTPYEALAAGTKNIAAYFGTQDSSGTVAVGKRADLVLLSGNPLEDIRHTAEPAGVMVGGRWLPRAEIDRRVAAIRAYYTGHD